MFFFFSGKLIPRPSLIFSFFFFIQVHQEHPDIQDYLDLLEYPVLQAGKVRQALRLLDHQVQMVFLVGMVTKVYLEREETPV